jgi:hypothetical protein
VARFRADTEARLAVLRAVEPTNTGSGHDRCQRFLLRYGIDRAELELRWADDVAHALERGPE